MILQFHPRPAGQERPARQAGADDWQAAADDAELCLPLLDDAIRLRMLAPPAGPLAAAAAPVLPWPGDFVTLRD